jgi:hypothetical protein
VNSGVASQSRRLASATLKSKPARPSAWMTAVSRSCASPLRWRLTSWSYSYAPSAVLARASPALAGMLQLAGQDEERLGVCGRWVVGPHPVDERVDGDRLPRLTCPARSAQDSRAGLTPIVEGRTRWGIAHRRQGGLS